MSGTASAMTATLGIVCAMLPRLTMISRNGLPMRDSASAPRAAPTARPMRLAMRDEHDLLRHEHRQRHGGVEHGLDVGHERVQQA